MRIMITLEGLARGRGSLAIVQPETVIRWHREGFRLYWRRKSRPRGPGGPSVAGGTELVRRVGGMGIEEVVISASSPWQSPYVERLTGRISCVASHR